MKKLKTDVVVISGGTAGMPAAVMAAEGGASVIVFEKMNITGGTANRGNMIFAVESRIQKLSKPVLTKEEAFRIHMDFTHWLVDARLVSEYINKSADTIDWLEKMGVEFHPIQHWGGHPGTAHVVKGSPPGPKQIGQAAAMMKVLTQKAIDLGVQIILKTPVTKILKKGGRIVGVTAKDKSGEEIRVDTKAVIIATGGFSGNKKWVKKYAGYDEGKDLFSFKMASLVGDGIRMAWELGAATTDMHMGLMHHLPPPCHGPGGTAVEFGFFQRPSNIMVNFDGERFIPEDIRAGSVSFIGNAISRQKRRGAFMLFDGNLKEYYDENPVKPLGAGSGAEPYRTFKHENLDDNIREAQKRGYKYLFMADSLQKLCVQTGIDLEGLKKTIAEYNLACEKGRDDIFHKNPKNLKPIKGVPKFYAARFFPGAYSSTGGIKINYKTEVVDKYDEPIPGLYAAGVDANAIYGESYVPLGGNYIGFAVNSGRMAGEHAAEYVKSIGK